MTRNDAVKPQMRSAHKNTHCCISREFSAAGAKNANKIAVVHASGGAILSPQLRTRTSIEDAAPAPVRQLLYDGDHSFTYSHLISAVGSLTSQLLSTPGLPCNYNKPSRRIFGLYMPPSAEYIVSVLSVLRCGEAFLPLDPSWPKQRLLSVISSANVDLIIACTTPFGFESNSNWLPEACGGRVLWFSMEEHKNGGIDWDWACKCESVKERPCWCYLMYTSGSTGKPKGVCGTEQGLLNRFLWMQELYPLFGDEVLLFKTGISFVDHLQEFLSAILTGCTLVIPPFNHLKRNVFSLVDFLLDKQIKKILEQLHKISHLMFTPYLAYSVNRLTAVPSLMRTILPSLHDQDDEQLPMSLDLLVLSGEVFPLSLWDMLSKILPRTTILNLYGSTEVSGDCTYFDCKRLPLILAADTLTTVPIGMPIVNCDVVLIGGDDVSNEGEIYVAGVCNSSGYYSDSIVTPLDTVKLSQDSVCCSSVNGRKSQYYFRTGDFAKQLRSGDLVFLGRQDRTIKLNGQRIALEEIEDTVRGHSDVIDAAVIFHKVQGELMLLIAFIILREGRPKEIFRSTIKSWMADKLPLAMIPGHIVVTESFPVSSSGKINYELLADSVFLAKHVQDGLGDIGSSNLLQLVKRAFRDVLSVEEISDDDDFFTMGGNSIAAAHLSNNIGVDMRLIYCFPSPSMLCTALLERKESLNINVSRDAKSKMNLEGNKPSFSHVHSDTPAAVNFDEQRRLLRTLSERNEDNAIISKRLKLDSNINFAGGSSPANGYPWNSVAICASCSFSRCNKVVYEGGSMVKDIYQATCSVMVPKSRNVPMQESWKVYMGSCVDASPIIVHKGQDIYLFIGSHSHKFMCVNARSGSVQWEIKLEGRVECSASILSDFTQVVVGCYRGKIYFLDFLNGNICWTFQTSGEVKSQPVVDSQRQLIWCGSYDHNLYALDYKNHCCVYQLSCGGSIYGSPAIDEMNNILYVASTSGQMTAISIAAFPFSILWLHELEAPVFGSLAINSLNGNIICCLVDGHVLALDTSGSVIWRYRTAGPIFAGACMSSALPFQALICSRDGSIYSLELETGDLLWQYNVKDPITSSAYVDEHLSLVSDRSNLPDRLVCICSSSGSVYLLRVNSGVAKAANEPIYVEEFSTLDLAGDVFSSPVMIGGRIFVGCRDDYIHCITVKA